MKTLHTALFMLVLAMPVAAAAQGAPQPRARPATAAEPAAPLPAWDQLSAEQREALIAPVRERWNASPQERAKLLERARRWQALPPEQRARAHRGVSRFEDMDPQQRRQARVIFLHMRDMDAEQSRAFSERWSTMTPEQRQQWLREHLPKDPPRP